MSDDQHEKAAEDRAREIAAQDQLSMLDVVAVVVGLHPGENGDCVVGHEGIRPLSFPPEELKRLSDAERDAIGDYARDLLLDFPCTPRALLHWARRQLNHEGGYKLFAVFEQTVRERLGKKPAHRPRKLDDLRQLARAAARSIIAEQPEARDWKPWKIVRDPRFIEKVFPGREPCKPADVKTEPAYSHRYGTGPRELERAVRAVQTGTRTADK